MAAYNATLGSPARAQLGLAITIDLIRRGDVARWIALRGDGRRELDSAILEADDTHDVSAVMLALASVKGAMSTVVTWCGRDPKRIEMLATKLDDESFLVFAHDLDYKLSEVLVPRLADILARRSEAPIRSRAAFELMCQANLGRDVSVARDALRAALDDDSYYGSPADDAARALARMGEPGLDRDPRNMVRLGASRAHVNFLGLLDPEPSNRTRIAADLHERITNDAALSPSREELQCLLAEILDPVVAEVVYAVIDRGTVAAVIAGLEPRGMARHLVAAARAVLDHKPPPVCRTCWKIARHVSNADDSPRGLTSVVEANDKGNMRCTECGTSYVSETYDMGDIYGSTRTTIERLPAEDPAEVERWRDRLDHPELWVRKDAAWIVGRRAAKNRDQKTIDQLVTHPDADVRREAWHVMPVDLLQRALDDTDDEIREYAAGALFGNDPSVLAQLLRRDPNVAFVAAARAGWNKSYPDEVIQALRARMLAARGQTKPDRAFDSVCRMLGGALDKTPDQRIVDEAIEIAVSSPPAIQTSILYLLGGCVESTDTSGIDDALVALPRDLETREAAAQFLRDRAVAHKPLRIDHLQMLTGLDLDRHDHMAVTVFDEAVRVEATRAAGFAGLLALAGKPDDTIASPKVHELAKEIPLGDVAPRVLELAQRVSGGYARQELVAALLVDAARRNDLAFAASLVDHPNPAVAQTARYAVQFNAELSGLRALARG